MEVDPATSSDIVRAAFANRNEAQAQDAQMRVLRQVLNTDQQSAVQLLQMMGIGQNLDTIA